MAPSQTQLRQDHTASAAPARPRRRQGTFWTALAAVEVLLAAVAVLLNLTSFPPLVILALAGVSLAVRREGLATLGFRRAPHFWRMAGTVLGLVAGWGLLSLGLLRPVLNHLTGTTEDLSDYANLQGNLGMLAGLLLITWTVAAFGEEIAYRGSSRPGSPTSSAAAWAAPPPPWWRPRCCSGWPTPSTASSGWP